MPAKKSSPDKSKKSNVQVRDLKPRKNVHGGLKAGASEVLMAMGPGPSVVIKQP